MKKILIISVSVVALLLVIYFSFNNNKKYLNTETLETIMFDYNYLTGNTEETTKKYFEELSQNSKNYSIELLKEKNIYMENPEEAVLHIQAEYSNIIKDLSEDEKAQIDKYLLENSLEYYYTNKI